MTLINVNAAALDKVLQAAIARGDVPGLAATVVGRDGVRYEAAFGQRALDDAKAVTPDTVFWIASMTKALTSTACLQLVERGVLDLDADCGRLVPALANPRVLDGFDASGTPIFRPARSPVTLRQLLTHTSGFAYERWNDKMLRYSKLTGLTRFETFGRPEDCQPLAFDPGTDWAYGIGIDWACKVLEAATGETLERYLSAHVLGPLGMGSTGYRLQPGIAARLAGMHQRDAEGQLLVMPFMPSQDPVTFMGGGGLYSTVQDYGRFLRMVLYGGSLDGARILSAETVAMMGRGQIGSLTVHPLKTFEPAQSHDADLLRGAPATWGLSYLINTADMEGRRRAGSLAWAGLFNTYFWIDPATGIAATLMTQLLPFADRPVLGILDDFERAVYTGAQ